MDDDDGSTSRHGVHEIFKLGECTYFSGEDEEEEEDCDLDLCDAESLLQGWRRETSIDQYRRDNMALDTVVGRVRLSPEMPVDESDCEAGQTEEPVHEMEIEINEPLEDQEEAVLQEDSPPITHLNMTAEKEANDANIERDCEGRTDHSQPSPACTTHTDNLLKTDRMEDKDTEAPLIEVSLQPTEAELPQEATCTQESNSYKLDSVTAEEGLECTSVVSTAPMPRTVTEGETVFPSPCLSSSKKRKSPSYSNASFVSPPFDKKIRVEHNSHKKAVISGELVSFDYDLAASQLSFDDSQSFKMEQSPFQLKESWKSHNNTVLKEVACTPGVFEYGMNAEGESEEEENLKHTSLFVAAALGDIELVKHAIRDRQDPRTYEPRETPIPVHPKRQLITQNEDQQPKIPPTTGTGKTILVDKQHLKNYSDAFDHQDPKVLHQSDNRRIPSLFTSGSGKQLTIDKKQADKCSKFLEGTTSDSPAVDAGPPNTLDCTDPVQKDQGKVASLFSTGKGNRVMFDPKNISKVGTLFDDENKSDESAQSLQIEAVPALHSVVQSAFSTGRGKVIGIQPKSLKRAENLLNDISSVVVPNENVDPEQYFPSTPSVIKKIGEEINTRLDSSARDDTGGPFHPQSVPDAKCGEKISSMFSTGKGRSILVDKKNLERFEQLLVEDSSVQSVSLSQSRPVGVGSIQLKNSNIIPDVAFTPMKSSTSKATGSSTVTSRSKSVSKAFVAPRQFATTATPSPAVRRIAATTGHLTRKKQFTSPMVKTPNSKVSMKLLTPKLTAKTDVLELVIPSTRVCLRDVFGSSLEHLSEEDIETEAFPYLMAVTADNAHMVVFIDASDSTRWELCKNDEEAMTHLAAIKSHLVSVGIDEKLLSLEWIRNHYRLIVWKLAAMDRTARVCTPNGIPQGPFLKLDRVINQLFYRIKVEIYDAKRSCLHKIMEKDAAPSNHMVLCVSAIRSGSANAMIELTDGWYSITAKLDSVLSRAVQIGKIKAGTKLHICGASLQGTETGIGPLECKVNNANAGGNVALCITANGTRLAKWDERLGFRRTAFCLSLDAVQGNGGPVPNLVAIVSRVYNVSSDTLNLSFDSNIKLQLRYLEAGEPGTRRTLTENEYNDKNQHKGNLGINDGYEETDICEEETVNQHPMDATPYICVSLLSSMRWSTVKGEITFWGRNAHQVLGNLQEGTRVCFHSLLPTFSNKAFPNGNKMISFKASPQTFWVKLEGDLSDTEYMPRTLTQTEQLSEMDAGEEVI